MIDKLSWTSCRFWSVNFLANSLAIVCGGQRFRAVGGLCVCGGGEASKGLLAAALAGSSLQPAKGD